MKSILKQLSSHCSVRRFKEVAVEQGLLETMVKSAQCAATSNHVQAYTIVQVNDSSIRKQIADLAGPQLWVEQAPVFLVFCADLARLSGVCRAQVGEPENGWAEQFIVATVDAALVAQNLMVAAESQGLGGVFIGGIRNNPEKVCDLLDIPDQAYPVFGLCLGYPDGPHEVKPRLPLELVLRQDSFSGRKKEASEALSAYDQTMAQYYAGRATHARDQTWSRQMADFMSQANRPHMKAFLEKKGLFLK